MKSSLQPRILVVIIVFVFALFSAAVITPYTANAIHGGANSESGDPNSKGDTQHTNGGGGNDSVTQILCEDKQGMKIECPTLDPSAFVCPIKVNEPVITRPTTGEFKYKLYWNGKILLEILNPDKTRRIYDTRTTPETDAIRPTDQLGTYTARLIQSNTGGKVLCSVTYKVVAPQCRDGKDNGDTEDTLADAADPGCHTDGNPNNPASYDPEDDDEKNATTPPPDVGTTKPNLKATIGDLPAMTAGAAANVQIITSNTTGLPIDTPSERAITFQKYPLAINAVTVSWSNLNTYVANQVRDNVKTVTAPNADGDYKVCAVADVNNIIAESNELDNADCDDVYIGAAAQKPNLLSALGSVSSRLTAGQSLSIPVTITNTTGIDITTDSDRRITFKQEGKPAFVFWSGSGKYLPNAVWSRTKTGTAPTVPGTYRVCLRADTANVIDEENETDNISCRPDLIEVIDPTDNPDTDGPNDNPNTQCRDGRDNDDDDLIDMADSDCTSPSDPTEGNPATPTAGTLEDPTLTAAPTLVRRGETSKLTWNTGGHTGCVIRGGDETISNPQNSRTGTADTEPIVAQTTYTMTCARASADATIKVLPSLQEI